MSPRKLFPSDKYKTAEFREKAGSLRQEFDKLPYGITRKGRRQHDPMVDDLPALTPRQAFVLKVITDLINEAGEAVTPFKLRKRLGLDPITMRRHIKALVVRKVILHRPWTKKAPGRIAVIGMVPPAPPAKVALQAQIGLMWRWVGLQAHADAGGATRDVRDGTWERIGPDDPTGNRSTWIRVLMEPGHERDSAWSPRPPDRNIEAIEMCSGPAGGASYVRIDHANPQFTSIADTLLASVWCSRAVSEVPSAVDPG